MNSFRHEIPKSQSEKIVIKRSDINGKSQVDIRIYFRNGDDSWHPTKRGISIQLRHLLEVRLAFEMLAEAIESEKGKRYA